MNESTTPPTGGSEGATRLDDFESLWTPAARVARRERRDREERPDSQQHFATCLLVSDVLTYLTTVSLLGLTEANSPRVPSDDAIRLSRASSTGSWVEVLAGLLRAPELGAQSSPEVIDWLYAIQRFFGQKKKRSDDDRIRSAAAPLLELRDRCVGEGRSLIRNPTPLDLLWAFTEVRNKTVGHAAYGPAFWADGVAAMQGALDYLLAESPLWSAELFVVVPANEGKTTARLLRGVDPVEANSSIAGDVEGVGCAHMGSSWGLPPLVWVDEADNACYFANGSWREADSSAEFLCHGIEGRTPEDGKVRRQLPSYSRESDRELPPSETEGLSAFKDDDLGFNLPPSPLNYVRREMLEDELRRNLLDTSKRHLINLRGIGGTGKTTLVLKLAHELHEAGDQCPYQQIIWCSARQTDLTLGGPKEVQPGTATVDEVWGLYGNLWGIDSLDDARSALESDLCDSGTPTLLILDNFETMEDQEEAYKYFDDAVRPPSKVVITSRQYFQGDFQIEVRGMELEEASKLIRDTAREAGREPLFADSAVVEKVYEGCQGHPYAMKLIAASATTTGSVTQVLNRHLRDDDLLDALFRESVEYLGDDEERLFLLVGAFDRGLSEVGLLAAARALEIDDLHGSLNTLRQRSLIEIHAGPYASQYSLPTMAREFAKRYINGHVYQSELEGEKTHIMSITGLSDGDLPAAEKSISQLAKELQGVERDRLIVALEEIARYEPRAYANLARIAGSASLSAEAREQVALAFKRAIEEKPTDAQIYLDYAEFEADPTRSIELKVQAVQIARDNPVLASNIASLLVEVNKVNSSLFSRQRWKVLMQGVASVLWDLQERLDGKDWSRLGWLELNTQNESKGRLAVERGLKVDPYNRHLVGLADRLGIRRDVP